MLTLLEVVMNDTHCAVKKGVGPVSRLLSWPQSLGLDHNAIEEGPNIEFQHERAALIIFLPTTNSFALLLLLSFQGNRSLTAPTRTWHLLRINCWTSKLLTIQQCLTLTCFLVAPMKISSVASMDYVPAV
jgi:hypothetical protein